MQKRALLRAALGLAYLLAAAARAGDDNWPRFRGRTGPGYTTEKNLPITWGGKDNENVLWKSPLVGQGHACPSPPTDGKLLYCASGAAVLAALDFQGQIVWRKEIVPYTFDVTIGSSPILYQDTLILLCAMAEKKDSKVIAFDKHKGKVQWEQKLPNTGFGHSTPVIVEVQ